MTTHPHREPDPGPDQDPDPDLLDDIREQACRIRRGLYSPLAKLRYLRTRRAIVQAARRLQHLPGPHADQVHRLLEHAFVALDESVARAEELTRAPESCTVAGRSAVHDLQARAQHLKHQALVRTAEQAGLTGPQRLALLGLHRRHVDDVHQVPHLLGPLLLRHDDDPVVCVQMLEDTADIPYGDLLRQMPDARPRSHTAWRAMVLSHTDEDHIALAERVAGLSERELATLASLLGDWSGKVADAIDAADLLADGRIDAVG